MKHWSIFTCIFSVFLISFQSYAQKTSEYWDSHSKSLLVRIISEDLISNSDSAFLYKIISNRSDFLRDRLDSKHESGYGFIYIVEEYDTKKDSMTVTERYFSSSSPKYYRFCQVQDNQLKVDSVQIANMKFINDCTAKDDNPIDPFYKGNIKVIGEYMDSISDFGYVPAVIESEIITPGCGQTSRAVEQEYKKLQRKSPKTKRSTVYRIETFINGDEVFVSLQVPKKMKPILHVDAQTF